MNTLFLQGKIIIKYFRISDNMKLTSTRRKMIPFLLLSPTTKIRSNNSVFPVSIPILVLGNLRRGKTFIRTKRMIKIH
jgi:hypothetical protein